MYETSTTPDRTKAADIADYLAVHNMIRRSTRAFAIAASSAGHLDRQRAIALDRYWRGYAGELHAHHTIEDKIFMPALIERVPSVAPHIAQVDADHEKLDTLIEAGNAAFAALRSGSTSDAIGEIMWDLDRLMCAHLDFEDDDLVPLFARHFDQDEYDAMHARALKVIGVGRQALFTVPFIAQWMDASIWAQMYEGAPAPLKVIYRMSRRSHQRLTHRALGTSAAEVAR